MTHIRTSPLHKPGDTFQASQPVDTHFRSATCREVECSKFRNGWTTYVNEAADLGQRQAAFIRGGKRGYREERSEGGLTAFHFSPGQEFFASDQHVHRVPVGREPIFTQQRRDMPTRRLVFAEWTESFNETMHKAAAERR